MDWSMPVTIKTTNNTLFNYGQVTKVKMIKTKCFMDVFRSSKSYLRNTNDSK